MTTLADRAMLVTLNISQWTARKQDRKETAAINARHHLTVDAARVHKDLLPLASSLDRVHQKTAAIRREFAHRTAPWLTDGVNILKATAYMDFVQIVNRWQDEWNAEVDAFVDNYPALVNEARLLLNGLFREEDYPRPDEIRRKFGLAIRFLPVPSHEDWRIDIGDEAKERLREDIRKQLAEAEAKAVGEAWKRIHAVVAKAHERLSKPENIFRDSLVENAIELCAILPTLNITDDPALERVRQELEGSLCKYNAGTLRDDPKVRSDVADKMADIMSKMAGFAPLVAA